MLDLRWSEKTVMKALNCWNAVFAQGHGEQERDEDEEMIPVSQEPNPNVARRPRVWSSQLFRLKQCKVVYPVRACRLRFRQVPSE